MNPDPLATADPPDARPLATFTAPAPTLARPSTRAVLREHDFRLLLVMQVASSIRQPMLFFAQAWYVNLAAPESQRLLLLGLLGAVRGGVFLAYVLLGGAIADRFSRRHALLVSHTLALVVSTGIGLLLFSPRVAHGEGPWLWIMIPLFASFGLITGQDQPTRTAMVRDAVPAGALTGAIMLHQFAMSLAFIPAAPLSGWALAQLGFATTYLLSGIGHVVVIVAALAMRSADTPADPSARGESILANLRGGLDVLRDDRVVRWTVFLSWLVMAAGLSVMGILVAAWVHDVLLLDSEGWGWMALCWGVGGIISSAWIAWRRDFRRKGALFLAMCALMGVAVFAFGLSRSVPAAFFWNGVAGFATTLILTLGIALVQESVPNRVLGRVTALLMLSQGLMQVTALFVGVIAQVVGLEVVYPIAGLVILVFTLATVVMQRELRAAP